MRTEGVSDLRRRMAGSGVVAVLVLDRVEHAVPVARALVDGGVDVMELTLRTPVAMDALRAIRVEVPEMVAGVGTVLATDQVTQVAEAGAAFGVAPGLNGRVVREAQRVGLPFFPGVATPSEVEEALEVGCRLLKFFPAEPSGGLAYLRSMAAPYEHLNLRFIPLGGLEVGHVRSYLREPTVLAVGGSWVAPRHLVTQRDWAAIAANAREASAIVREVRGG